MRLRNRRVPSMSYCQADSERGAWQGEGMRWPRYPSASPVPPSSDRRFVVRKRLQVNVIRTRTGGTRSLRRPAHSYSHTSFSPPRGILVCSRDAWALASRTSHLSRGPYVRSGCGGSTYGESFRLSVQCEPSKYLHYEREISTPVNHTMDFRCVQMS